MSRPLCVDLDGTLCRSDTLAEAFFALLKQQPWVLLLAPFWLLRGRAHFKQQLSVRVELSLASLPWHEDLLAWLRQQHASGRELVLCTGADARIAEAVSAHFGIFSAVLASDGQRNLVGAAKREALVARYGERGYDYAGNEALDLKVWASAGAAIVVGASPALLAQAGQLAPVEISFSVQPIPAFKLWRKALRLHQWVKNSLVFLPLLLAHRYELLSLAEATLAFVAFSLCASSVYLLNDLLDLEADRGHPRKRRRPFASGALPLSQGIIASLLLLLAALALASYSQPGFLLYLSGYYLLTLAYSINLKRKPLVDVMTLAALYTLRILAGGAATALPVSFWLLAFSMFLFLSLSVVKRYAEMHLIKANSGDTAPGRGYHIDDLPLLRNFGIASGYAAVLVLALYVNSPESLLGYRHPHWLWLLCPLILYWIGRVWLLTHRGEMQDDPLVFALRDGNSRVIAVLAATVLLAAALWP